MMLRRRKIMVQCLYCLLKSILLNEETEQKNNQPEINLQVKQI